jgi:hypothetical protein
MKSLVELDRTENTWILMLFFECEPTGSFSIVPAKIWADMPYSNKVL